jgi:hypothetical protein
MTPHHITPPLALIIITSQLSSCPCACDPTYQDPYEALLLATREDRACPVDVGLLNGKPFMNSASIGASADIGKTTSSQIKKVLGPAAFLFTGREGGVGRAVHMQSNCTWV